MRAVDTHAHLDFPQFDGDRKAVLEQLKRKEVGIINIATNFDSNQKVIELANSNDLVWATVGLHPTDINSDTLADLNSQLERLKTLAQSNQKVVAIGEVGLDYYREESRQMAETQKSVLRQFLTLAKELDLPVVFHCRDAYGDLVTLLADYPGIRGVVHCFTGDADEARRFLNLGLLISFTATVTYPANESQRQAIKALPLDKILLETDCPFLAPQSRRGQRNDPMAIFEIARTMAELRGSSEEAVISQTTANAVGLFGLSKS